MTRPAKIPQPVQPHFESEQRAGFGALFQSGRARDAITIWAAFFMFLLTVYSAFGWLPAMLASEGLSPAIAGPGLTAYNLGEVFGALMCAVVITRFGSHWLMAICCVGAAASAAGCGISFLQLKEQASC